MLKFDCFWSESNEVEREELNNSVYARDVVQVKFCKYKIFILAKQSY